MTTDADQSPTADKMTEAAIQGEYIRIESIQGSTPSILMGSLAPLAEEPTEKPVHQIPLEAFTIEGLDGLQESIAAEKARRVNTAKNEDFMRALRRFQTCFRSEVLWTMCGLSPEEWAIHPEKKECFERMAKLYAAHSKTLATAADFMGLVRNTFAKDQRSLIYIMLQTSNGPQERTREELYSKPGIASYLSGIAWSLEGDVSVLELHHVVIADAVQRYANPLFLDTQIVAEVKSALLKISRPETLTRLYVDVLNQMV